MVTVVKGKLIHQRLKRKLCSPVIHIFHDDVIMLPIENHRQKKWQIIYVFVRHRKIIDISVCDWLSFYAQYASVISVKMID